MFITVTVDDRYADVVDRARLETGANVIDLAVSEWLQAREKGQAEADISAIVKGVATQQVKNRFKAKYGV